MNGFVFERYFARRAAPINGRVQGTVRLRGSRFSDKDATGATQRGNGDERDILGLFWVCSSPSTRKDGCPMKGLDRGVYKVESRDKWEEGLQDTEEESKGTVKERQKTQGWEMTSRQSTGIKQTSRVKRYVNRDLHDETKCRRRERRGWKQTAL